MDDCKDRLALIGQTTAQWAHQIRSSLCSAKLYSEHLHTQGFCHERSQIWLAAIEDCHRQMALQIEALLFFARGDALTLAEVDLRDFAVKLEERAHALANAKETVIQLTIQLQKNVYWLHEESVLSIVLNLVTNAMQAGARHISLSLNYQQGQSLLIKVTDDGLGMSKAVKDQAFSPFFTTKACGTGLGLAVAEAVIKAHKGKIQLDSSPGEGTVVTITLPE